MENRKQENKTFNQEICVPTHLSDTINKWSTKKKENKKTKSPHGTKLFATRPIDPLQTKKT